MKNLTFPSAVELNLPAKGGHIKNNKTKEDMKKIYMKPEMAMTKVEIQTVLAGSFAMNGEGELTSGNLIDEDADSEGLSRFFDFDDEGDY